MAARLGYAAATDAARTRAFRSPTPVPIGVRLARRPVEQ
jgi:hypothetical protein